MISFSRSKVKMTKISPQMFLFSFFFPFSFLEDRIEYIQTAYMLLSVHVDIINKA